MTTFKLFLNSGISIFIWTFRYNTQWYWIYIKLSYCISNNHWNNPKFGPYRGQKWDTNMLKYSFFRNICKNRQLRAKYAKMYCNKLIKMLKNSWNRYFQYILKISGLWYSTSSISYFVPRTKHIEISCDRFIIYLVKIQKYLRNWNYFYFVPKTKHIDISCDRFIIYFVKI